MLQQGKGQRTPTRQLPAKKIGLPLPSSPVKMFKNQRNPYIQEKPHAIQKPKLGKNEDSKEPGV